MRIVRRYGDNYNVRMQDVYNAKVNELEAKLAYVAMMTDVDLPTTTVSEETITEGDN